jgi:hypothetical protein
MILREPLPPRSYPGTWRRSAGRIVAIKSVRLGATRLVRRERCALKFGLSGKLAVGNGLRHLPEERKSPGKATPSKGVRDPWFSLLKIWAFNR